MEEVWCRKKRFRQQKIKRTLNYCRGIIQEMADISTGCSISQQDAEHYRKKHKFLVPLPPPYIALHAHIILGEGKNSLYSSKRESLNIDCNGYLKESH